MNGFDLSTGEYVEQRSCAQAARASPRASPQVPLCDGRGKCLILLSSALVIRENHDVNGKQQTSDSCLRFLILLMAKAKLLTCT